LPTGTWRVRTCWRSRAASTTAGAYVGFAKAILGDHSLGMQGRGRIDPGAVIRPDPGEWHPRMPERLGENELADWRAGRDAIYQLAALTVGARLAVADG